MWTDAAATLRKKPDFKKLAAYGFIETNESYTYEKPLAENQFHLTVFVSKNGELSIEIIDTKTKEEYALAYVKTAAGSLARQVRVESEQIVSDIIETCYVPNIFQSEYANLILHYVEEKYGSKAEYLWEKFPNNAVFREPKTRKWYAALLSVEKKKLGIDEEGFVEILDVKEKPEEILRLVDGVRYRPGYHMNKKHWYTMLLDGSVSIEELCQRIDASYALV